MDMKDRIKKIRKDKDLTQQAFADKIGTSQNTYANYEIGRRNPSNSVVNNICKTFDVNEEWLRTGQGEIYIQKTWADEIADFVNKIQTDNNPFKAKLIQVLSKMTDAEWILLEKLFDRMTEEESKP